MSELPPDSSVEEAPPPADDLGDEQALAGSPQVTAANGALRALSKSARAFALYEPKNEAIRKFLSDFRDKMQAALTACGTLQLEIRPFEMRLGDEVVYAESDRERSLAYRLFRDGVRRIRFDPAVSWDELLRFLEILSVRFTGVRQQEDDIVTLLTKAAFKGITFEATEGFVAENDDEEDPGGSEFGGGPRAAVEHVAAPADFDLPLPAHEAPVGFSFREVPLRFLQPLRAEETAETVPTRAVRLVAELLRAAGEKGSGLRAADIQAPVVEVRDFLLADRRLGALLELARELQSAPSPLAEAFAPVIAELATPASLVKLLETVPVEASEAPPELAELLDRAGGDLLTRLLDRLSAEGERRVKIVRSLIGQRAAAQPELVLARLKTATPEVAHALLSILLEVAPQLGLSAAIELAEQPDADVQMRVLEILRAAPSADRVSSLLMKLAASPDEDVRVKATEIIGARCEARAFDLLVRAADSRSETLSAREATAIGEALARLVPGTALTTFTGWIRPKKGLMNRLAAPAGQRMLHWVAVAGLGAMKHADAEALIKEVSQKADEELKQHCIETMQKRRRGAKPRG